MWHVRGVMQAHKSRKVRAFTGVNLFFCFLADQVSIFCWFEWYFCSLLDSTVWGMIWPFESFSSTFAFQSLLYIYITFGRFMTDLCCRFWILIWQTAFINISCSLFTCGREKLFGMSFFKIPRLPSHWQMDEQLPRAFKQSFNQFHGTSECWSILALMPRYCWC